VPGGRLFLQTVQDIRIGARQSNAEYQFTLQADSVSDLYAWAPKLLAALQTSPVVADVNSDQQQKGLETEVSYDRATAARLGLTVGQMDSTLYDAFGQRQVSTIYNALNQYHVVMEVAPRYWQSPAMLDDMYISTAGGPASGTQGTNSLTTPAAGASMAGAASAPVAASTVAVSTVAAPGVAASTAAAPSTASAASTVSLANSVQNALTNAIANTGRGAVSTGAAVSASVETMVPLAAVSRHSAGTTRLSVNHHGLFAATTISFNLQPGMSLSDATRAVTQAMEEIH
jgi:multidrug efflux pump